MLRKDLREALIRASLKGIAKDQLLVLYARGEDLVAYMASGDLPLDLERLLTKGSLKKLKEARKVDMAQVEDYFFARGIHSLVVEDDFYPDHLAKIEDPPVVLYYMGDIHILEKPGLGIVGARKHTDYGQRTCRKIIEDLAGYEIMTISGMALGIDGVCHQASLDQGLETVAVLGNGIDSYYPKKHRALWEAIRAQGLVLSEYPPGTQALPFHFPQRNRIIAGLAQALLVVEAQEKSGSLITARLAAGMGREIFALPGNIDSLYSAGCNALIRDGANIFLNSQDLAHQMGWERDLKKEEALHPLEDLSEEEREVYQAILEGLSHVDQLAAKLPYETPKILANLTILEMKGYITSLGAGLYQPS
ncbi:MAG: DNA-processing protein DprA [Tissierellia bacterium]|nr:DNA-processing protein DprA [Tissierellia bacterium]